MMQRAATSSMLLACAALLAPMARAQQPPYMTLVGELAGAIESPRVVMQTCLARKSGRRGDYQQAYEAWRGRHAALLAQAEEQFVRADARLKRDNPGAAADTVTGAMSRILQRRYESLDATQLRQLCERYPEMLRAKDAEMQGSVPELLRRVGDADRALAAREGR